MSADIDLEEVRLEIADKLERHFRHLFVSGVKLQLLAIHPSNPNAHLFVGQASLERAQEALRELAASHPTPAPTELT